MSKHQNTFPNEIRIIAGRWRGRKLKVAENASLRPTPSRVRETLFNWLMFDVQEATCLDLFAGTGALGFEALSRGAKKAVFIEPDKASVALLKHNADILPECAAEIVVDTAENYLARTKEQFDVIFLDPPFLDQKLIPTLDLLLKSNAVHDNTLIYVESDAFPEWPNPLSLYKQSKAAHVHFGLLKKQTAK